MTLVIIPLILVVLAVIAVRAGDYVRAWESVRDARDPSLIAKGTQSSGETTPNASVQSEASLALRLASARVALPPKIIEAYRDDYKEFLEAWKNIETKAQGTVAISAIFLAAAFTYAARVGDDTPDTHRWALIVAVVTLTAAVLLALVSLWTRGVDAPPYLRTATDLVRLLYTSKEEFLERQAGIATDQIQRWYESVQSLRSRYAWKTRWLYCAQGAILFGALVVGALVIATVVQA